MKDRLSIDDIVEACEKIEKYVEGVSFNDFTENTKRLMQL